MSDVAIRVETLRKVYRLYQKPHHRLLDVFGLLPAGRGVSGEHVALDDVSFTIRPGEKVAIIGRNGAGKSTLLKLIAGVVSPTSGTVQAVGDVSALLSLGTGFHPEFTGRENVVSYLAHLGITGPEAERLCRDIVDFAELHEYIDQPLKTYSAGMGMRLGFAAATVIRPDVLIIDEVLSVGDAYFFKKSYERIKEICTAHGTTLLMVTHDLYAAQTFCERCIWIDGGRMRMDGPIKSVVQGYERSIRDQEEVRLRQRRLSVLQDNRGEAGERIDVLFGEIRVPGGSPPEFFVAVSHIEFRSGGSRLGALTVDVTAPDQQLYIVDDEQEGNWGPWDEHYGRMARQFQPHGSIFHKLPFVVADPAIVAAARAGTLEMEIGCRTQANQDLEVSLAQADGSERITARFQVEADAWRAVRVSFATDTSSSEAAADGPQIARYGQRAMEITDVSFLDASGEESLQFEIGSAMRVRLRYRINKPDFDEKPTLIIAFQKNGTLRTNRFVTEDIRLSAAEAPEGVLDVVADPLLLSCGTYLINIVVFAEGFMRSGNTGRFFATNDQLYDMHARAYEIKVLPASDDPLKNDVVFMHPSTWVLNAAGGE